MADSEDLFDVITRSLYCEELRIVSYMPEIKQSCSRHGVGQREEQMTWWRYDQGCIQQQTSGLDVKKIHYTPTE